MNDRHRNACLVIALALAPGRTQDPPPVAEAARLGLETLYVIPLDGKVLPTVVELRYRTSLDRLCFQGDGTRLFLGTLRGPHAPPERPAHDLAAIDIGSGKVASITPENGARCLGASPHGPVLFDGSTLTAPGAPGWKVLPVPERTDAFVSPYGPKVLLCTLGRTMEVRLVDFTTGTGPRLRLGNHHASAVAFAPNGRVAIARAMFGEGDRITSEGIRVVDAEGKVVRDLPPASRGVTALAFAAAGERLVHVDDRLHLVALADGKELIRTDDAPRFWADLGAHAAVSHDGLAVRLHDPATLGRVKEFPLQASVPAGMSARLQSLGGVLLTAVTADGTLLAVATYDAVTVFRIRKA